KRTRALHPIDAHRIETGFYREFAKRGVGFEVAVAKPIESIDTSRLQPAAGFAVAMLNTKGMSDASARMRIYAAVGKALSDVSDPADIKPVIQAFTKTLYEAELLSYASYSRISTYGADELKRFAGEMRGYAVRSMLTALVIERVGVGPEGPTADDIATMQQ